MENQTSFMESQVNLQLDNQAVEALRSSAKWSMFIAIMGFIGIGFLVLLAIFMAILIPSIPNTGMPFENFKVYLSLFYVILAALYFPPVYYMYKYAADMKSGLISRSSDMVSKALVALKSHHKFIGISIIVIISLYILTIIGVMVFAVSNRM